VTPPTGVEERRYFAVRKRATRARGEGEVSDGFPRAQAPTKKMLTGADDSIAELDRLVAMRSHRVFVGQESVILRA
jgi:hypothetical protein